MAPKKLQPGSKWAHLDKDGDGVADDTDGDGTPDYLDAD